MVSTKYYDWFGLNSQATAFTNETDRSDTAVLHIVFQSGSPVWAQFT
jgi:hypothetical protein